MTFRVQSPSSLPSVFALFRPLTFNLLHTLPQPSYICPVPPPSGLKYFPRTNPSWTSSESLVTLSVILTRGLRPILQGGFRIHPLTLFCDPPLSWNILIFSPSPCSCILAQPPFIPSLLLNRTISIIGAGASIEGLGQRSLGVAAGWKPFLVIYRPPGPVSTATLPQSSSFVITAPSSSFYPSSSLISSTRLPLPGDPGPREGILS